MWHRLDHEADLFLGEACVPLVHLMDLEPHRGWYALTDPQGKRPRAGGGGGDQPWHARLRGACGELLASG